MEIIPFFCNLDEQVWQGNVAGSCAKCNLCKCNRNYLEYVETKQHVNSCSGGMLISNLHPLSLLTLFSLSLSCFFLFLLSSLPPPPLSLCSLLFPLVFHRLPLFYSSPPFISYASLSPITPSICFPSSFLPHITSSTHQKSPPSIFSTNREMIRDTDSPETQIPPACRGESRDATLNGRAEIWRREIAMKDGSNKFSFLVHVDTASVLPAFTQETCLVFKISSRSGLGLHFCLGFG